MKGKNEDFIMKKKGFILPVIMGFILSFGSLFTAADSEAMPYFARAVSKNCTFCHTVFPKLNENGRIFRSNGYRFAEDAGEGVWKDVKDWTSMPVSMEVEVEGVINDYDSGKTETDLKVEEVEIMLGGVMGKEGKISALGVFGVEQDPDGSPEYESFTGPAYVQVNDIAGPVGEGKLNIRAGQWALSLPFLGTDQRVVKNKYLAQDNLSVLTGEQLSVEINGSVVAEEDSGRPTHRYNVGISRDDVNADDKMKGLFASYALTFSEIYNVGLIYRSTHSGSGGADVEVSKMGLAGDAKVGPAYLTAGYFISDEDGGAEKTNYLLEGLYTLSKKTVLGARYDVVTEDNKQDIKAKVLSARHSIVSNVYTQLEYRALDTVDKVRIYLVALF